MPELWNRSAYLKWVITPIYDIDSSICLVEQIRFQYKRCQAYFIVSLLIDLQQGLSQFLEVWLSEI